ncbi:hypothetical protein CH304_00355 [Rhodococcus sp. 15-649-1-2]|nr:hypothetical protein CH304_00355 [Rhodococcus sp. 15-649-1-2]
MVLVAGAAEAAGEVVQDADGFRFVAAPDEPLAVCTASDAGVVEGVVFGEERGEVWVALQG